MSYYICEQCGVQYADAPQPPSRCIICDEERQYINPNGQRWLTLEELQGERRNIFTQVEPNLTSIRTEPSFAIGQTAHLIQTPQGNVLWDCISLIDNETIQMIENLGGLSAIAISHPHFYSTSVEWSQAFGGIPIYINQADQQWMPRSSEHIHFWQSETPLHINDEISIVQCGGHFEGSSVLLWKSGAGGKGVLFTSDTIMICADPSWVTFMHSYPNMIPLHPKKLMGIVSAVMPLQFDRLYNAFGRTTVKNAKHSIIESAIRYVTAMDHSSYLLKLFAMRNGLTE
jgi:hypothetical protein